MAKSDNELLKTLSQHKKAAVSLVNELEKNQVDWLDTDTKVRELDEHLSAYVYALDVYVNTYSRRSDYETLEKILHPSIIEIFCAILFNGFEAHRTARWISVDGRNEASYNALKKINSAESCPNLLYGERNIFYTDRLSKTRSFVAMMHHTLQQSCMRMFGGYYLLAERNNRRFKSKKTKIIARVLSTSGFPFI